MILPNTFGNVYLLILKIISIELHRINHIFYNNVNNTNSNNHITNIYFLICK